MRHVRLVSFEDQVTGEVGLGFKGHTSHPNLLSDREGGLIAHDIVEHQRGLGAIGSVEDELIALGALWQVRGSLGFPDREVYSYYSPDRTLAIEVSRCASDLNNEEDQTWHPRIGRYRTHAHHCDEEFEEIIKMAKPMIRDEVGHSEGFFDIEAFADNALHLMRTGYRMAERRWGRYGIDQFIAIRNAVRPHAKCATNAGIEGREFRLSYGGNRARCVEVFPTDEW